jgi:hypothetical protein
MKNIKSRFLPGITILFLLFTLASCNKNLDIPLPTNSITSVSAFSSKGGIDGLMTQMYISFADNLSAGVSMPGQAAALADDVYNPSSFLLQDYQVNNMTPLTATSFIPWDGAYKAIYMANMMLEGIPNANAVGFADTDKKQYMAAAKTVRAFAYFDLVRCYGDVPLLTSTNTEQNKLKGRTSKTDVYAQIEKDLTEAITDLPATLGAKYFINNKYIPEAILANVYLTEGKWAAAESAATDIIGSNKYQLSNVANVFLQTSTETIMAIAYTTIFNSVNSPKTSPLSLLLWPAGSVSYEGISGALSPDLLNNFEKNDLRMTNWVKLSNTAAYPNDGNRMFSYKYKYNIAVNVPIPAGSEEETKFIRLAEVYLIRAEARARQSNLDGASSDLNVIRTRAGLPNIASLAQADMINAVLKERRAELFCENGSRWFDLVRTNTANTVLSAISYKSANWKPYMVLFPLDQTTLSTNPNLTQTPGY